MDERAVHVAMLFDDSVDDSDLQVIELAPARVAEAESERYELYRKTWCKEFRDIRKMARCSRGFALRKPWAELTSREANECRPRADVATR